MKEKSMDRKRMIAVIGAGECDAKIYEIAQDVGRRIARAGCVLVSGGLGGVMEAASRGARKEGGITIGILPGVLARDANAYIDYPIVTGMGDARNVIIVNTAEAFVAIAGALGTLTEVAFAIKRRKRVVSLHSWDVHPDVLTAQSPEEAVQMALYD